MARGLASRKWQLTINNPEKHNFSHEAIKEALNGFSSLVYWCMCDEVGETGTYHTHLFIAFKNAVMFSTLKKSFSSAHFEVANGTSKQNRDYIRKEGKWEKDKKRETNLVDTFEEFGEMPVERQGSRNDLSDLYDSIKAGKSNFEILEESPEFLFNIDKVERARQIVRDNEFKNKYRELDVTYMWGDSGSGKTRSVMEKYGYENVYRVTDYDHPFDGYKGQDVLVFEEFRSSLPVGDMLNFLDGYPLDLPCRYSNKVACFTKIYIITNLPIAQQYMTVQSAYNTTWEAFKRRIHHFEEKLTDKELKVVETPFTFDVPTFYEEIDCCEN